MADCCLKGLVYAADDCRPIWAIAEPGAAATTFLEMDMTPYTGAVFGDASLCGGGGGSNVTFSDDGNDSTWTLNVDGTEQPLLSTVRVNDGKWDRGRDYNPDNDILLHDRNVSNGGDPDAAGGPSVGSWPYINADILVDPALRTHTTGAYKRGSDGLIVGPPEHDATSEGFFFSANPEGTITVDNDGIGPTDLVRWDLGTITNPHPARLSTLTVQYHMTSAMVCVADGSSALIEATIENAGVELQPSGTPSRITAINMRNRSFDPCPMDQGHIGGGSFTLQAGGVAPGQTIDMGEFVIKATFSGFQEQTADGLAFSNGVFTQITWRALWNTESV